MSTHRKNLIFFIAGISFFVIFLSIFNIGSTLELKLLNWRFILRGENPATDKIFLVAMGDESVSPEALGRWPWRRAYMASFINMMIPYSPHSIILDILFTEPDEENSGDDELLAEQSSLMGNVYFPFYCIPESTAKIRGYKDELHPVNEQLIKNISLGKAADFKNACFINVKHLVMPIPRFSLTVSGSGYVNAIPDRDGITRRIPLIMQYRDYLVPNVAFYAALDYLGVKKEDIIIKPGKYIVLKIKERIIKIPVDKKCQMLINHSGEFKPENINMASFVSVIGSHDAILSGGTPQIDLKNLKNKIIFVGLTATGTSDLRPTPFTPLFPMVGVLATVTSNIIEEDFLKPVSVWINYLIIIIVSLIASVITIKFKAIPSALLNILLVLVYFFISFLLFKKNCVVSTFYPFEAVIFSYAAITIYSFTREEKEKKVIRGMFQRYVSSQVVDVLLSHPEQISLGGERKRLTVFFSDIRGFTSMSEKLSPEEVVSILNEYLTEMIDIIFKYHGTLDKFIGDAVMAVWGAPVEQKNHAELATTAAWAMKEKIHELQEKWEKEGKEKIRVGMGINTGDVVVGNMGSDQFADYTVIGDNVNLAARLEENAKGGQLIISESTYEEVKDIVEVKKLEALKVKGKEKPVQVYEVTGLL